jgi:hypothetical protein
MGPKKRKVHRKAGGEVTSVTSKGERADDPTAGEETKINTGLAGLAALTDKKRKKKKVEKPPESPKKEVPTGDSTKEQAENLKKNRKNFPY